MNETPPRFRIGLTRDFLDQQGKLVFKDIGLGLLAASPFVEYQFMAQRAEVMQPKQIENYDGVISLDPRYGPESFVGVNRLVAIGRFGVGYDNIDVQACTDAGVLLFITKGSVDRPVAEAILTLMLSLSHRVFQKDRLVRNGGWNDRIYWMGTELRNKVIGTVGLGGIASALCRLLVSFGVEKILAYDPYREETEARSLGVELVSLETLFQSSDFVTVNCPLNENTRDLITARELSLMKPTAYFINTARGGIVNQRDITEMLAQRRIQGAALDVFEQEPISQDDPLLSLDNVILAPHAIAWTDEAFLANGTMDCLGMLKLAQGEIPDHVVNPEVLGKPSFHKKLQRFRRGNSER
ncbi:MAG: dehydrogenase [Acidobacteria bacterium]|nr:dehydrogenase [Acidobacteriota bacterium]MCI0718854.1 dehydrogenase [Acidobacteriota bacterium]